MNNPKLSKIYQILDLVSTTSYILWLYEDATTLSKDVNVYTDTEDRDSRAWVLTYTRVVPETKSLRQL